LIDMPGLLRGVARTAVVAGTATAVSNRVSRRQANRWADQGNAQPAYMAPVQSQPPPDAYQQQAYQQQAYQQPAYQQPPEPAGADYDTKLTQLKQLGELRDAGVLTDAEFEMQKSKILNS
jgi:hypothetical protein